MYYLIDIAPGTAYNDGPRPSGAGRVGRGGEWRFIVGDNYPVDSSNLSKRGTRGILSTGAGAGILILNGILHFPVIGAVIGGVLVVLGISGIFSKTRTDKVAGTVALVIGAAGLTSVLGAIPIIGSLARFSSTVLGVGAIGLIGYGIYNIVKFVRGLRHRG